MDHWGQGAGLVRYCSPVMYDFHGWSRPQLAAKVRLSLSWWKYISTDFYDKKTIKNTWNTFDKPLWTFAIGVNHGSRFHTVADALWTLEFHEILIIFFWPWTFSALGNIQAVLNHHQLHPIKVSTKLYILWGARGTARGHVFFSSGRFFTEPWNYGMKPSIGDRLVSLS